MTNINGMSDPAREDEARGLEPVHSEENSQSAAPWTLRLVFFLRMMAVLSLLKGLYHWSRVCGIMVAPDDTFELHSIAWQAATVFFAVIDLVAAVGLWLAAAWGAVIWLTSVVSMIALDLFFPQVFQGGRMLDLGEFAALGIYLWFALKSAQEQPA
jgi:fatty acid desaturase